MRGVYVMSVKLFSRRHCDFASAAAICLLDPCPQHPFPIGPLWSCRPNKTKRRVASCQQALPASNAHHAGFAGEFTPGDLTRLERCLPGAIFYKEPDGKVRRWQQAYGLKTIKPI